MASHSPFVVDFSFDIHRQSRAAHFGKDFRGRVGNKTGQDAIHEGVATSGKRIC